MADTVHGQKRPFREIPVQTSTEAMSNRFLNMLNKVETMVNETNVYSTWIRFQLGISSGITFNTSSDSKKENLIASLRVKKSGAWAANEFTLVVKYDPFNYGQNPTDKLERLDDLLAQALSYDLTDDTNLNDYRGYLQYGYNYTDDLDRVSPKYQFILTGADYSVDVTSGVATYTFTGVSELAVDSDYTTTFKSQTEKVDLIKYVGTVLYHFYGTAKQSPSFLLTDTEYGGDIAEGSPGYYIDIPDDVINDSPKVRLDEKAQMTPIQYCQNILNNQFSESDSSSDKYSAIYKLQDCERPQYTIYLTEADGAKTIHVAYVSPLDNSKNNLLTNYNFTWDQQTTSLVLRWEPKVDLRLYLIQKARILRSKVDINAFMNEASRTTADYYSAANSAYNIDDLLNKYGTAKEALQKYKSYLEQVTPTAREYPGATLTLLGIPADVPVGAVLKITPVVLQSVSRLGGYYVVQESIDEINNNGLFRTTIELFRIKGYSGLDTTENVEEQLKELEEDYSRRVEDVMLGVDRPTW